MVEHWRSQAGCYHEYFHFSFDRTRFPKKTGVDRARRHCSVETIRGTGPSELGWSRPISKNPLERAWPQWDQRRLSNRREQILHFDLSRKGREAITFRSNRTLFHRPCTDTSHISKSNSRMREWNVLGHCCMCISVVERVRSLITTYQEVNDQHWSNTQLRWRKCAV